MNPNLLLIGGIAVIGLLTYALIYAHKPRWTEGKLKKFLSQHSVPHEQWEKDDLDELLQNLKRGVARLEVKSDRLTLTLTMLIVEIRHGDLSLVHSEPSSPHFLHFVHPNANLGIEVRHVMRSTFGILLTNESSVTYDEGVMIQMKANPYAGVVVMHDAVLAQIWLAQSAFRKNGLKGPDGKVYSWKVLPSSHS